MIIVLFRLAFDVIVVVSVDQAIVKRVEADLCQVALLLDVP